MAKQSNPTASSVLDALNSEEEISSEDNESEYDNTSDCEVTEERMDQEIEQDGTDSEQGNKLTSGLTPSSSSSIPSLLSVLRAPRLSDFCSNFVHHTLYYIARLCSNIIVYLKITTCTIHYWYKNFRIMITMSSIKE